MTLAIVFPGQGSQSQGMLADLASEHDEVRRTFGEASDQLGYDLWALVQDGPAEKLNETVVTQPAMLAAGVATWRVWQKLGGASPAQMAGHSLGEYAALVCSGALAFTDAVALVQRRSQLMADAVPGGEGAMAAVLGLDDDSIEDVCEEASGIGVCEPVNFNSPGQVVIAGHRGAIQRVVELAKDQGARRAILLSVSVPSHSSLMRSAGEALAESLQATEFSVPGIPVVNSVDASPYGDANDVRERLTRQVYSPVRWVRTVRYLIDNGASSFVECGPGKVLTGLSKRIDRAVPIVCVDSRDAMQQALQS